MKKFSKILSLSALSLGALVSLLLLGAGLWIHVYGRALLSNTLRYRWGLDVHVQKVRTNFLNTIRIEGFKMVRPIEVSVDQASVAFRPWNLILPQKDNTAFQVVLDGWSVQLSSASSSQKSSSRLIPPFLQTPFPVGFHFRNGAINVPLGDGKFLFRKINIQGRVSAFGARAEAQAELPSGHTLRATAFARGFNFRPHITISADQVPAADAYDLAQLFDARLPGDADGNLRIDAGLSGLGLQSFDVSSKRLRWHRDNETPWISVSGRVRGSLDKVDSVDLLFAESIRIKGSLSHLRTNPTLRLTAEGKDVSLGLLEKVLVGNDAAIHLEGRSSFQARLEGNLAQPSVEGQIDVSPVVNGLKFPPTSSQIHYRDHVFELSGTSSGGQVNMTVLGRPNENLHGMFRVSDFSVENIAALNGWSNVTGTVSTRLQWENRESGPVVNGPFSATGFAWGRLPALASMNGTVSVESGNWEILTSSNVLTLRAKKIETMWNVDQAQLVFGPNSDLTAHGALDTVGSQNDIAVTIRDVPPDAWPPLVHQYPEIIGGLDAKGSIKGRLAEPTYDFSVGFHHIQFIHAGASWEGTARASGDAKKFTLSDIRVAGGYTGRLEFVRSDPLKWSAAAKFDQANPQLVADLLKKNFVATGTITGSADFSYDDHWKGLAQIEWKNGNLIQNFDSLSGNVTLDRDQVKIDDLSWVQGSQALRGSGVIKAGAHSWWDADLTLQAQQFGTSALKADGEIRIQATGRPDFSTVRGKLVSTVLWINGGSVENLALSFDKVGDWLTVHGGADPLFEFWVRSGVESDRLSGWFKAHAVKVENVLKSYVPGLDPEMIPEGRCDLDVQVSGQRTNPLIRAKVNVSEAKWRDESFKGEVLIHVSSSSVNIETGQATLDKGGVLYTHGDISLAPNGKFHLEGAGDNLNLNSIFNLADLNLPWEGKIDTTFVVSGGDGQKTAKFVFSGRHEELTPFSGAGTIRGEAVLKNGELGLSNVTVTAGEGYAKLLKGSSIFVNRDGSGALRLPLEVRNIQLGPLSLFGAMELQGSWSGEANSLLKPEERPLELDVFAKSLWVNQLTLDGNVTHLTILPGHILFSSIGNARQHLSGQLHYEKEKQITAREIRFQDGDQERVFLDGELGSEHWDYTLRLRSVDAAQLRGLLDTTLTLDGGMDFDLTGRGNLEHPKVSGTVSWRNGHLEDIPVDAASAKLEWTRGKISLSNLEATRHHGYHLNGSISFGIGEEADHTPLKMNLRIHDGDLAILKDMWPEVRKSKGAFEAEVAVDHEVKGMLNVSDVALQTDAYIPQLKSGQLHIALDDNKLTVTKGEATLNKGKIVFGGSVLFSELRPAFYDLSLQTITSHGPSVNVPDLAIPPGAVLGHFGVLGRKLSEVSRGDPVINVTFKGPDQSPLLAGHVQLQNTFFTYPAPADKKKGGPTPTMRWLETLLNRTVWDLVIETGDRTWYENELVNAKIRGSLHLAGPTSDLSVNGRIETNSGSLVYTGSEFKIDDALLEVITPSTTTFQESQRQTLVYLKATAEREVFYSDALGNSNQDTIVMAVDRSLIGEIQPRFYSKSNPNISPQKAIKLALGLDVSDPNAESSLLATPVANNQNPADVNRALRVGLVQLLDSNLASPMARAIARQTGLVDYIRVTYQQDEQIPEGAVAANGQATSNSATQNDWLKYMKGTKVKLGRELSNRLFADYSFKVDEFQNQVDLRHEVELAYRLHKNLFLRATSELDSERTLGRPPDRRALLENQWRFDFRRRKKAAPPVADDKNKPASRPGATKG